MLLSILAVHTSSCEFRGFSACLARHHRKHYLARHCQHVGWRGSLCAPAPRRVTTSRRRSRTERLKFTCCLGSRFHRARHWRAHLPCTHAASPRVSSARKRGLRRRPEVPAPCPRSVPEAMSWRTARRPRSVPPQSVSWRSRRRHRRGAARGSRSCRAGRLLRLERLWGCLVEASRTCPCPAPPPEPPGDFQPQSLLCPPLTPRTPPPHTQQA